ncbi:MAG: hypothetical protein ACR2M3_04440 [Thermomicrobiales bacterium]
MRNGIVVLIGLCLAVSLFGSPVRAADGTASATFFVPATAGGGTDMLGGTPWFDTGLLLAPGTMVTIRAEGRWTDCNNHTCSATPDGNGVERFDGCAFIAPEFSAGSLIARTGKNEPVFVGAGPTTIMGYGKLKFAINDCYFGDNVGGFTVTVMYPTDLVVTNSDAEGAG